MCACSRTVDAAGSIKGEEDIVDVIVQLGFDFAEAGVILKGDGPAFVFISTRGRFTIQSFADDLEDGQSAADEASAFGDSLEIGDNAFGKPFGVGEAIVNSGTAVF